MSMRPDNGIPFQPSLDDNPLTSADADQLAAGLDPRELELPDEVPVEEAELDTDPEATTTP